MTKPTPLGRSATYEDLREVPDNLVAELLGGDLWVSPRPAPRHAHVLGALIAHLAPPFQHGRGGPGGWQLLPEVELHFHGDVLVPDLAGWRNDRKLKLMEQAYIRDAPDWVCEILSKSTRRIDRTLKLGIYAREHVRHVWLVDPRRRTLEVFKLVAGIYVPKLTFRENVMAAAEPFDAVPFLLKQIWPER